jgi:hypothetical protein
MITFNNIVSKFEEFCDNHFFIKTFSYGSPSDVDLEKFEQYPLLHLVYTGGDYNSPKAKTYNLEVYILSVPPSDADKVGYQKENISDAERVAEDILADIQNGGNIFQFGFHYDLVNASVTPLEETQSNALAGCLLDIAISVPYTYDSCNAPLTGVEPEGSTTPSYKARGLLRVRELDGSPDVLSVATINVPNGSLTDDGDGEITLEFGTGSGLPAGSDNDTVVYNGTSGEWEAGHPISAGQVSSWTANSTHTQNITGTGLVGVSFGSVLGATLTFDQECRAGWNMGMNLGASQLLGAPLAITSTVQVNITVRINAPVGSLAIFQVGGSVGWFTAPTYTGATIIGNGVETEYQITSSVGTVNFWQLANSTSIQLNVAVNPGTIVVKPQSIQIDITHA